MARTEYQEVTVECEADGMKVHPIELEYSSRHDFGAAGYILRGLTKNAERPERNARTQLSINGEPICAGPVYVSDVDDENVVTFEVFDVQRRLNIEKFTQSYVDEQPSTVARDIFKTAGVKFSADTLDIPPLYDDFVEFTHHFKNVTFTKALNTFALAVDGIWYVDGQNRCHFEMSSNSPFEHYDLERVLEFEEGQVSVPWKTVKVIGRAPAWEGEHQEHMMSSEPVVGYAPIPKRMREEPVYEYESNEISTVNTAQLVARGIFRNFKRQRGKGSARIVGDARLRPGDSVTLPSFFDKENYGIKSVTHTVNDEKGFTTEVDFNGFLGNDNDVLPPEDGGWIPNEEERAREKRQENEAQ